MQFYFSFVDNWLDLVILAMVVGGIIIGLSQGLVRQVLMLCGLYVASVLALQYYAPVSNYAHLLWPHTDPSSRVMFGMALVFLVSFVTMYLVSYWLYQETRLPTMSLVDRGGGAVAGAAGGWILAAILVNLLGISFRFVWGGWEATELTTQSQFNTSMLVPVLNSQVPILLNTVRPWLPAGLQLPFFV